MTFLPIKNKPDLTSLESFVIEIENIIPSNVADSLIQYGYDNECWTRMTAKSRGVTGKFSTYMLYDFSHIIYDHINHIWEEFMTLHPEFNLTFIEPCEIKGYHTSDYFNIHRDNYPLQCNNEDRIVNLIIQLSDQNSYDGGGLGMMTINGPYYAKKLKCNGIFFMADYSHWVTDVTNGSRYSLISHAWGKN